MSANTSSSADSARRQGRPGRHAGKAGDGGGSQIWTSTSAALIVVCLAWTIYLSAAWTSDVRIPTTMLERVSWDEYQYLPHLHSLQTHLLAGRVHAFLTEPEIFGYGDLFWQVYAIAALPVAKTLATDSLWGVIWLRYVTLAFQLGSLVVSVLLVRRLTARAELRYAGPLAALILAPMPGLMLLYKPLSPDYLATFLTLLGLLLATPTGDDSAQRSRFIRCLAAALCTGAGIATKVYNVLLLPLFVVCLVDYGLPKVRHWPRLLTAFAGGTAGVLLANTTLFSTGIKPFLGKYRQLAAAMNSNDFMHAIRPPGLLHRVAAWWSNPNTSALNGINTAGIAREFFPLLGLAAMLAVATLMILRRRSAGRFPRGALFLISGLLAMGLTIVLTNRVWTWYIISPVFVVAIGLASTMTLGSARQRFLWLLPTAAVALHVVLLAPEWVEKYTTHLFARDTLIAECRPYVQEVVTPYHALVASLPPGSIVASYKAPIEPIPTGWLIWSSELRPYVGGGTLLISAKDVTAADRAYFLQHGFKERRFAGGYSLFLAAGLKDPVRS